MKLASTRPWCCRQVCPWGRECSDSCNLLSGLFKSQTQPRIYLNHLLSCSQIVLQFLFSILFSFLLYKKEPIIFKPMPIHQTLTICFHMKCMEHDCILYCNRRGIWFVYETFIKLTDHTESLELSDYWRLLLSSRHNCRLHNRRGQLDQRECGIVWQH